MNSLNLAVLGTAACIAVSSPAMARDYWDFKDWTVTVELSKSEEDDHKTCRIFTGGDGLPTAGATFFSGDAGPPHAYPEIFVEERAVRGHPTIMQNGVPVFFTFDDGDGLNGTVEAGFDDEGFAYAFGRVPFEDNVLALQAMRRNGELTVTIPGHSVLTASLNGFTAAYGKMAEQCGFSTEGVID